METVKVIQKLPLGAVSNQFWGAVRVYIEKLHIINRRLCGTTNLWVGSSHEDFSRENLLESLTDILNHSYIDDSESFVLQSNSNNIEITDSHLGNDVMKKEDSKPLTHTCVSDEDSDINIELELSKLEAVKNILHKQKFRTIQEEESYLYHSIATSEKLENIGKVEFDALLSSKISQFENGQYGIPWQRVLGSVDTPLVLVCIRRLLPKHTKKFSPSLEVVLIGKAFLF